jgi:putative methyltransferase (TIGR04325 family)
MKAVFKIILKKILPPLVSDFLRNSQPIHFTGNYNSWDEASRKCLGYDDYLILKKVKSSALLVKTGKAVYERDSVIFENIEYSWPLLSGLLYSAVKNKGVLRVMDFGGSLGSTFFQNRKFISEIPEAIWGIIEQESFYQFGRDHIQGDKLIFFKSIKECVHAINPTVVIFSAVLQYLKNPEEILEIIFKTDINFIIIDRTSFVPKGNVSKIVIQKVDETIYNASYPCHFFNEESFVNMFEKNGFFINEEFYTNDSAGIPSFFKGFIFERKSK